MLSQPSLYDAWYHLSLILNSLGHHEESIKACESALQLKQDDYEIYAAYAHSICMTGNATEAFKILNQAIPHFSDKNEACNQFARKFDEFGYYDYAIALYDEALIHRPYDGFTHMHRADIFFGLQRYEEALSSYEQAILYKLDDEEMQNNQKSFFRKLIQNAEIDGTPVVVSGDYGNSYALHNKRGLCLFYLGHYEASIMSFEHAIRCKQEEVSTSSEEFYQIKNDYHEAYYYRGAVLVNLG